MIRIAQTLCGCMICLHALGCSCSRDDSRTWPARQAAPTESDPAAPVALANDELDAPEEASPQQSPEVPEKPYKADEHPTPGGQANGAPTPDTSSTRDGALDASPAQSGTAGMEVIEPAPGPAGGSAKDARQVASEVKQDMKKAESLAERKQYGEACRRLLAAYEKLDSKGDGADETLSALRESVLDKLKNYGEQANRAAGGETVGGGLGKPLSVK